MVTELQNRGEKDIFIACVGGLKGFPEAIESIFPDTQIQLCLVHMVRHSLNYVSWKQRKAVAEDLKAIYQAPTIEQAEIAMDGFAVKWDDTHPTISRSWRRNWERLTPLFSYPTDIRKAIYTTNAIESVNMSLRKVTKNRGSFPNDEAMLISDGTRCGNICKHSGRYGRHVAEKGEPNVSWVITANRKAMQHAPRIFRQAAGPSTPGMYEVAAETETGV